jgi:hypothetical protein
MKLVNPTDDQLNAAFAEKVAGWLRAERMGKEVLYDPEGGHVLIGDTRCMPSFTTSADAVLPWLAKTGRWQCDYGRPHALGYRIYFPQNSDGEAASESFARTAVIALLRAHGVEVEFS